MTKVAAVVGLVVTVLLGFFLLGNSQSAEGPPGTTGSSGGVAQGGGGSTPPPAFGSAPRGTPVAGATVQRRDVLQVLEASGSLKSDEDVEIGTRMEGRVARVTVKEGDRVQAGQMLVVLEDQELQAQLARVRAAAAAARARLSLARNQAQWKDATARSEVERTLGLLATARSRLQQAETNLKLVETQTRIATETARSGVRVATERLSIARDLTRKQELRQAQLAVEQAQAELGRARVDVANAKQSLERRQTLFRQDAIAREEVDEAERRHLALQAQARVAEAGVSAAQQKLELAREGSRPEEVRIAEGQLAAAERNLVQAQSDEQRRQVAAEEVEAARAAVRQAEAAVASAEAGKVQPRMSEDEIASARAALAQAEADIRFYETQLRDLRVRAPVSGVIATRQVNAGEMVTRTSRLMHLVALDALYLEVVVPELDATLVRPELSARISVDSRPGATLQGTVRELIPVAERNSRSFRVRIALSGERGTLPAGGFARARIHVGTHRGALTVPKASINSESGDKYVWLIEAGEAGKLVVLRRQIRVGLVDDQYAEVLSGLQAGDRVVGVGSPTLVDGSPVTVTAQ